MRYADDLVWMMYPSLCAACNRPLFNGEDCICTPCRFHLPRTGFHLLPGNQIEKQFWGKIKICRATAYLFFSKGQKVQKLIHHLKYKGRKDVGLFIGQLMGNELRNSAFEDTELILPVPLHKARQRRRGYNQSDCLAEGLSAGLKKEFDPYAIERVEATSTQTRKHRYDRYRNVENIFNVRNARTLEGKNILLVDDVITTGSTLISCAETILKIPGTKVSIAAIACA